MSDLILLASYAVVIVVSVVILMGWLVRRARGGFHGPTLVLRKFTIDETPSAKVLVDIAGRASGITAWLLTITGFSAETTLSVTGEEISFRSSSLFGQTHQIVPLPMVSSTHCGYSVSIEYFIIGVIFMIGGILQGFALAQQGLAQQDAVVFFLGLVVSAIFFVLYYLSKKLVISIETSGGMVLGLRFRRSIIENVSVDIEQALKVIRIVNQKVIESREFGGFMAGIVKCAVRRCKFAEPVKGDGSPS